ELVQHRARPERRTYLGKGKLEQLKRAYRESGAEVLLVDDELEPAQQRTLEDTLQARVVDRTQLILDIFAQHAVSAEGKLQVELAGYTNVGKSTLLNGLTQADVSVKNRLFETLDPTTRAFEHDGRKYLVTDTVGFIRRLPTQLVEGFAATLEETLVADLVLHV